MTNVADRLEMILDGTKNRTDYLPDWAVTTTHDDVIVNAEFLAESMVVFGDDEKAVELATKLILSSLSDPDNDDIELFLERLSEDENPTDDQLSVMREVIMGWVNSDLAEDVEVLNEEVEDYIESLRK